MYFVTCNVNASPCPVDQQGLVDFLSLLDLSQLGITTESILKTISWGFGFVFASFILGWTVSLAVGLIRKL